MKNFNFKIRKFFCVPLLFTLTLLAIPSCNYFETEDPPRECEINNEYTLIIGNHTGIEIYVEITLTNITYPTESVKVQNNIERTYSKISATSYRIWASFDEAYWVFVDYSATPCEFTRFNWKLGGIKPSGGSYFLLEIRDIDGTLLNTVVFN